MNIFQYSQKQTNKHRLFALLLISMLMALSTAYAQPPAAAMLTSPSGSLGSDSPTYTWNAVSNASWYFLWVDDSSGNAIKQWYRASEAGCASGHGTCSVTPGTTLNHGAGRWWIQTWNDSDGYGPWSNAMSFAVGASLGAAALVAPQDDITVATPKYSWNAVASASWYYLWVNDSSGNVIKQWYRASEVGCGSGSGTCSMTHATALNQGAGQWWVQTWNAASGYGPWSSAMLFNLSEGDPGNIILHGGKPDNSGEGDYYPWDDADAIRGLVFDAHKPFVLKSVKVYNQAGQAATRTFTLYDGSNNEIAHKTVAVPENESRIQLDMAIPAGHGYKLMADVHKGLYRNNNVSYPIRIGNVVTITGSDINRSHYYFFYDWEIAVTRDEPDSGGLIDRKVKYSNIIYENLGFRDFHVNMSVNVDDLTADNIQSAVDRASAAGGGVVRLSAGEGRLDHTIDMRNNVKLLGSLDGKGRKTRLVPTYDIGTMIRGRKVKNITVENIILDERGKEVYPLHFGGGGNNNLLFKNNVIVNAGIPKLEHANVDPLVRSEGHEYITGISFYSNGELSNNITVEGNYFANLAEHATEFRYVDNAVYNNNVVRNSGSGGETTTGSSNVEILNNDIADVLEGYKIYGSHNVVMHNNATHDNPIASYYDSYNDHVEEEGGGKGLFLQNLEDDSNVKIFDNFLDGALGPVIKNNASGYSLKNNRSSKGGIEEMSPDSITHSAGSDVFGLDTSHPLPEYIK